MDVLEFKYCFTLPDGSEETWNVQLDKSKINLLGDPSKHLPSWTKLDFHQCPNCPLGLDTHPNCPLSVSLVDLVTQFDRVLSYDKIHLKVITEERVIFQETTAQKGISSLMGLLMATSGCPVTSFFRPMARFHLPLASDEETIYRATSMYLLAQYFIKKEEGNADFDMIGLKKHYENIDIVNANIALRLRSAVKTDSMINALVLLDSYAKGFSSFSIDDSLEEIRYLFAPYLMGGIENRSKSDDNHG
jgi:hypothetical protein